MLKTVGNGAFAYNEQNASFHTLFSKPFKIGAFLAPRYTSYSSYTFIVNASKHGIWSKGLTGLACARDFKYFEVHVSV